jgi:hypothetical protein
VVPLALIVEAVILSSTVAGKDPMDERWVRIGSRGRVHADMEALTVNTRQSMVVRWYAFRRNSIMISMDGGVEDKWKEFAMERNGDFRNRSMLFGRRERIVWRVFVSTQLQCVHKTFTFGL